MGVAQNEDATGARELWRNFFDDEIKDYEDGSINQAVPIVIRDIVMPDSVSEAEIEKAALQLDEYNESILLVYDFLVCCSVYGKWSAILTPLRVQSWVLFDSYHMTTRGKTDWCSCSNICKKYPR